MPRLALTFLLFTLGGWSVILSAETCPSLMHHRCMYTWSRDICATSLCHLRLPEERRGEAVLVDVGRQDRHAVLRLVPGNGGGRRVLGQGCLQPRAGSSLPLRGCFTMFPRVWRLGCRVVVGERRTGGRSKEVAQCMVAPPLASAGRRHQSCGQLWGVQDDAEVAEPPELVGRLGGPAHLVCPRHADGHSQG